MQAIFRELLKPLLDAPLLCIDKNGCLLNKEKNTEYEVSPLKKFINNVKTNEFHSDDELKEFLELEIAELITCPLSYCVFLNPVVAEDGYIYENILISNHCDAHHTPTSPLTRQTISKVFYKIPFIVDLIKFCDTYGLDVSKDKYEGNTNFEEDIAFVYNELMANNFNVLLNYNKLNLSIPLNHSTFFECLCEKLGHDNFDIFKHTIDHAESLECTFSYGNIFHVMFYKKLSKKMLLYVGDKFGSMVQFNVVNKHNYYPPMYSENDESLETAFLLGFDTSGYLTSLITKAIECDFYNFELQVELLNMGCVNYDQIFHTSIWMDNLKMIDYLVLEKGCSFTKRGDIGKTKLHILFTDEVELSTVKYIFNVHNITLEDLELMDDNGFKPIHYACYYGTEDKVIFLVERNVSLNDYCFKFEGQFKEYLPIQLIELNKNINYDRKDVIIPYMSEVMRLQK